MSRRTSCSRPGGALALFWHRVTGHDRAVEPELHALFARDAPTLVDAGVDEDRAGEIRRSGLFTEVTERNYAWTQVYTTKRYVRLLTTHSEVRMLSDDRRLALLRRVRRLIDNRGGELTVSYTTRLFLARATDRARSVKGRGESVGRRD